ncbi:adenylate/guanylate cyclase domain-containing protein [Pseudaminobacter sp. 19-2017]|uniref:Adenylate/guanylate cyclase domain-containing protein n=1 Tax=Pseudaminobacter soli (ex Zhang et al. 2022) TaxID=2831468 RepID=A0A942I500_9HYPH|nr:adenylate/guanylate cyclase domain-containing protein [Pseudaminobacter soli]MBS3652264.1 adenylate/guanylate cyclase domain-containing protein [Pseudaminobacter soli]
MGRTAPIISWLHQQGLRGTASGKVLEGLSEQLLTAGIDLDRSVLAYLVFHPQFDGMHFTWTRSTRRAQRQAVIRTDILRVPSPFLKMQATGTREMRYRLDDPDVVLPFPFLDRLRSLGYKDYFAFFEPFGTYADRTVWPDLPDGLIMHEGVTGSYGTTREGGFNQSDIARFRDLSVPISVAVKVGAILEMAETLLSAYLGPASGRNVLLGHVRRGQGQIIRAVVWHSDLRGSTALAEITTFETYLSTLNSYYDCVVDAVIAHSGEVLKFIGDGVLAMFPFGTGALAEGEACEQAFAAGRDALTRLTSINAEQAAAGRAQIHCGIALHAGNLMYGNVGSAQRLDFTVMGSTVNEVVRLEALCKTLDVPLVLSEAVAAHLKEPLESWGWHALAGVSRKLEVFSPLGIGFGAGKA